MKGFWTTPASSRPLAVLRIGLALLLLLQAKLLAPQFHAIYGADGILQGSLRGIFGGTPLPGLAELLGLASKYGVAEETVLNCLGAAYITALVALLLGFHTRIASFGVWALHWLLVMGQVTSYGFDSFASLSLFYLVWMPSGEALSLDVASGRASGAPSSDARWGLRMLQLHLSIAYFTCGFDKAVGEQWWNGEAIWRSVTLPLYAQFDLRWIAKAPWLAVLSGWGTLVVECGYPIAMWFAKMRKAWLLAIVGLHFGIFLLMGLHLFGLLMILLSVSAFGVSAEPATETGRDVSRELAQDSFLRWRLRSV